MAASSEEEVFPNRPMPEFEIVTGRYVGGIHPCFIIADINDNHNGDFETAKFLIDKAMRCGAHCVNLQKSHIPSQFTRKALDRPFKGPYAFGSTYASHRRSLELTERDFVKLKGYAENRGLYFTASGTDKRSVDFLQELDVPFFTIASADCTNLPLLRHVCQYKKPIVISTGMCTASRLLKMYNEISERNESIALLQCTSCYPTCTSETNLNVIKSYRKMFPDAVIGYSSHQTELSTSLAAVSIGAKIFAKNITVANQLKEPNEFHQVVMEIRTIEEAMGSYYKNLQSCEWPCKEKLGKTLVASRFLPKKTILDDEMLVVKTTGGLVGSDPINIDKFIGRELNVCLITDDVIFEDDVN